MSEEMSDILNEETLSLITYTPVGEADAPSQPSMLDIVSGSSPADTEDQSKAVGQVIKAGASKAIGQVDVSAKLVEQQMRQLLQTMGGILGRAKQGAGDMAGMELQEVELSVQINAEGKVSLMGVGGTQAGATGAIKLKFGKPKP